MHSNSERFTNSNKVHQKSIQKPKARPRRSKLAHNKAQRQGRDKTTGRAFVRSGGQKRTCPEHTHIISFAPRGLFNYKASAHTPPCKARVLKDTRIHFIQHFVLSLFTCRQKEVLSLCRCVCFAYTEPSCACVVGRAHSYVGGIPRKSILVIFKQRSPHYIILC